MINYVHADENDFFHIQKFIKENLNADHILSKNKKVFSHFYVNKSDPQFFLAKDGEDTIVGILGYITSKQFDENLPYDIAWLAMWMSEKNITEPVGIKLLQFLENELEVDYVACLGINDQVVPLYSRMGYQTGSMHHLKKEIRNTDPIKKSDWSIIPQMSNDVSFEGEFGKTNQYLSNKYLVKRFYNYLTFSVCLNTEPVTTIIGRILINKESNISIFRIVDFSGDIEGISRFVENISNTHFSSKVHFIDILISDLEGLDAGIFTECDKDNYIPLYFEPLIREYMKKNFCYKKLSLRKESGKPLIITGDGDQERPNII